MEHAPDAELKKYQTKTVTRIPGTRTFTINPTKEQKIIIDDWIAAKCWNEMLARSTRESFQWGCEKAEKMGGILT